MKLFSVCVLAVAAAFSLAQYPGSQPIPAQYKKGVDAITIQDAKTWLEYLAGPECEGRGTLQPGFMKAAEYMAARFKEQGLKPIGDKGTYFQMVRFARSVIRPADSVLTSAKGDRRYAGEGEIHFGRLSRSVDVKGGVVFLRVGDNTKSVPADADIKGKLVFVVGSGATFEFRNQLVTKGVTAVVQVSDTVPTPSNRPGSQRVLSKNLAGVSVTKTAAVKLALASDIPASVIEGPTPAEGTVEVKPGKGEVRLVAQFDETDVVDVPNVVAYLPGSDPILKKELIGIGSHLDHLGKRGNEVYWGADDDGSGSTALISIAKALNSGTVKPKRSILFMAFCGEEMGLLGSGYYADNPLFPHEDMIAELQMDMIGRDSDGIQNGDRNRVDKKEENVDTMRLVGSKRISMDLHNLIIDVNKYINFKFKWDAEDVYTRSDHYNFAKHGIPIAFLFDGFHPDYHRPTDTVDKINFEKLTNAAKLYYMVALELANRPDRPKKDVIEKDTGG